MNAHDSILNLVAPSILREELIRVARIDRNWVDIKPLAFPEYACNINPFIRTWLPKYCTTGADILGMKAASIALLDGIKIFHPTEAQSRPLENVSVNLHIADFSSPYTALLVMVDYKPFTAVLVYHEPGYIVCVSQTPDYKDNIVTTIGNADAEIEESVTKYEDSIESELHLPAAKALRVALNSCLALSNFGHHSRYLLPHDVERDTKFARENSERGQKAKARLKEAIQVIAFSQEVKLHTSVYPDPNMTFGHTGREMSTHWRRGHWAMQAHGPQHSLRKRIFRPPVLVRADMFAGDLANTSTSYKG